MQRGARPTLDPQWRSKLVLQRRSKLVHTMEIQLGSVYTMEIQAGSHNGDPSWFTQRRSKLVHTMVIQAGSHNGDPSNGSPSCVNQRRSKLDLQRRSEPVPTMCKCPWWVTKTPPTPVCREVPGHCLEGPQWRSKLDLHCVNRLDLHCVIQLVHTWRSGSHNGDPSWFTQRRSSLVHTTEIQAGSHNGDPSWFTQRRSKPGSHNG